MRRFFSLWILGALAVSASAAVVNVEAGSGNIKQAANSASAGDVLVLGNGTYTETSVQISKALTVRAADGTQPVVKLSSRFETTADFTLQGVTVESTAEAVRMKTTATPYNVTVRDCRLSGCPSYFIRAYDSSESPYINHLMIDNCIFVMAGESANTSRGITATKAPVQMKRLTVKNSTFDGGQKGTGRMIYLHSGDENTVIALEGGVEVDHCTFYNTSDPRGVYLANIQGSHVSNCIFMNPAEVSGGVSFALYGTASVIENCITWYAPVKLSTGATAVHCMNHNPYFIDAANGNFQVYSNSSAVGAATDGSTLGDPRWGVSAKAYDKSDDPYVPYKMPYSMAPTTSSVKVLWQMADETEPTEAVVYYGTDSTNLNQTVTTSDGWNVADEGYVHVVTLTGLQPNTRYYFTVGANATRRCGKISWTKTAPEVGTAFRIFTISDIHGNARNNWSNMQDFICNLNCDVAFMNGDFVSSKGNDRNWNNYYFTPGAKFLGQVPVMSSSGNHETGDPRGLRWSSFYDYFHQFPHEGACEGDTIDPRNEAYFHFVYGNMDVIMLNLNGDESSPEFLPGSRQYQWADSVLNTCDRPWIIICHHVGVHTTGYHGQWADEPRRMGSLFEKYAAQGKRIISLSGDDHSFEHLYKDGVHYVRPGCGRDANYEQQKQLKDYQYSMFYRRVSCFSTLDMSADASTIALTAYDSVGNVFYNYTFLHDGEVITPSASFVFTDKTAEDSVKLQWCTFDPAGDAQVALYYAQSGSLTSTAGMTLIKDGLDAQTNKYIWRTRDVMPKGQYYVYAAVTSGGQTYLSKPFALTLLEDTTPPPAPTELGGYNDHGQYHLKWKNPTHLVHLQTPLEDFSNGVGNMVAVGEQGAEMQIQTADGCLRADYNLTAAWATAATEYVFATPADAHETPTLSFKLKGNGTGTSLRLVCKNMSSGHEDWWFTESHNLSSTQWKDVEVDMQRLSSFDWYANTDNFNHCEGLTRISFGISDGSAVSGTFYLDDIMLSGDILPAPDYLETIIVRKEGGYAASMNDGTIVYRGREEDCLDTSADINTVYYYSAYASDDRGNLSEPAQWCSTNLGVSNTGEETSAVKKIITDGQLVIVMPDGRSFSTMGQEITR